MAPKYMESGGKPPNGLQMDCRLSDRGPLLVRFPRASWVNVSPQLDLLVEDLLNAVQGIVHKVLGAVCVPAIAAQVSKVRAFGQHQSICPFTDFSTSWVVQATPEPACPKS